MEEERKRQRYVDEAEIVSPSVIILNAVAVAHAANDFLFYMTGLREPEVTQTYMRSQPKCRQTWFDEARKSPACPVCSAHPKSRLASGDARRLPTLEMRN